MRSRTENALKNTAWALVCKVVMLVIPFFIRAILIRVIGVEYVGLNSLFSSILNILNIAELGVGNAIVYSMYKPISENDVDTICALINYYRKAYFIIGVMITGIGFCLFPLLDRLIAGDIPEDVNIYVLFLIFLLNATVSYFALAYRSCILYAHQRNDIISKISIITNMIVYTLQIVFLCVFKNYYCYVILLPISSILNNLLNAWYSKKIYPQYCCCNEIDKHMKAEITKRIKGLILDKISYKSRNGLDSIVLSSFLGLTTVALYNNYYTVSNSVAGLVGLFATSLTASLGNSIVTETTDKNERDFRYINFIYMSISGFCFLFLIALFQPLMYIWLGKEAVFPDYLMFIICCYFLVERSLSVAGQYHDAAGLWWQSKWKGFMEAGANIILNIILCKMYSIIGVVAATIVSILFVGLPLSYYYNYKYCFKAKCRCALIRAYIFLFKFLIVGVVVYLVTSRISFYGKFTNILICMTVRAALAILIGAILYVVMFSIDKEFKQALNWLYVRLSAFIHKDKGV